MLCLNYIKYIRGFQYELYTRSLTFYTSSMQLKVNNEWHNLQSLGLPSDATIDFFGNTLLIQLRSDWKLNEQLSYKSGSEVSVGIEDFVSNGMSKASFTLLFEPTAYSSLEDITITKDNLILEILENVKCKLQFYRFDDTKGKLPWVEIGVEETAKIRGGYLYAVDHHTSNEYFMLSNSFVNSSSLCIGDATMGAESVALQKQIKKLKAQFNSDGLIEEQFEATSEDGVKVPYFLVRHKDLPFDGKAQTLLYGYGGFEISLKPVYSPIEGKGWLEKQEKDCYRCYVTANIRGGGEFGPAWHQAALKENRKKSYDDFIAVAEDLIKRNITSAERLGIRGGSNGGLLMGNMLTRRPDLFGAVCIAVPLLDMFAYNKLLAGASWMGEYGDPDTDDWEFLKKYSAFHNIDKNLENRYHYPPVLMTTSTRDDRVHPYHCRAFCDRLMKLEGKSSGPSKKIFYYENIEGG